MVRETIRTLYSSDRRRRVTIFRRDDETFGFREDQYSTEPFENCWIPGRNDSESFCDSEDTAIREAIGRIPWLGDMVARRQPIDGLPQTAVNGPPPKRIANAILICYSRIDQRHRHTGEGRQIVDGVVQGPVAALAICRYDGDSSCYLFGCDCDWNVITDTFHQTIEDAKRQAEVEYSGVTQTWEISAQFDLD